MVALVEPLTAAVIGIGAFGERLDAVGVTGTVILLASVLFLAVDEGLGHKRSPSVPEIESGNGEPTEPHTALRVKD